MHTGSGSGHQGGTGTVTEAGSMTHSQMGGSGPLGGTGTEVGIESGSGWGVTETGMLSTTPSGVGIARETGTAIGTGEAGTETATGIGTASTIPSETPSRTVSGIGAGMLPSVVIKVSSRLLSASEEHMWRKLGKGEGSGISVLSALLQSISVFVIEES